MARILVVEPVAQPGLDLLSAAHDAHLRLGLDRGALLGTLGEGGGWDALVVRASHGGWTQGSVAALGHPGLYTRAPLALFEMKCGLRPWGFGRGAGKPPLLSAPG